MLCTIKYGNDMKAVQAMEIKVLIVSKSTYSLIKWPQLILQLKFSKLRPNFRNATRHFLFSSPETPFGLLDKLCHSF